MSNAANVENWASTLHTPSLRFCTIQKKRNKRQKLL